ncbi:E3 ubiquitin-protein ligase RNF181 [Aplysia californica]|uniref:E3 ubiquitin-protein ligase RNF181 n=1 Tax=Aplysia californica TaxID=6500 RepID=A0ABM0K3V3_APLCA|nr:E3 ubiquitin-protein ligase RNF181 [Aplysia californica]
MASYFDEHDCQPLEDGQTPNHALHLARLLLDSGLAAEWDMEYNRFFGGEGRAPPASKKAVAELETKLVSPTIAALGKKCPICLLEFDEEDEVKIMPCGHQFHSGCILPWLSKVNSCPMCRYELPTDDPQYEEFKKHQARAKQREFELNSLHDSMFG